jgi:glycerophosphoryl diester phosphodiesterase
MRHSFFIAPRPLAFAHRGGAGLGPENTLAAFDHGLALGADGLELDVRLSRDGVVVVIHDASLNRTTNLAGPVSDRTADELARADATRSSPSFRGQGVGIPTLAEVLERYRDARIIVELKEDRPELARAAVDVVRRAGAVDRVCMGSYRLRVLRHVRRLEPAIATSAAREEVRWSLYRSWCRWPMGPNAKIAYAGFQVPEWAGATRVVSPAFVRAAHHARLSVQVWTVDTEADARRLLSWGVDALITDRPDVIVPVVRDPQSART